MTHIELKNSRLTASQLQQLLQIPKELKTFIFEVGEFNCGNPPINFEQLRKVLDHHEGCLENLLLDYEGKKGVEWVDENDEMTSMAAYATPMAAFTNLVAVKHLRITTIYLFGKHEDDPSNNNENSPEWNSSSRRRLTELLPPHLEVLHLCRCEDNRAHLPKALRDLLLRRPPSLKKLIVEGKM